MQQLLDKITLPYLLGAILFLASCTFFWFSFSPFGVGLSSDSLLYIQLADSPTFNSLNSQGEWVFNGETTPLFTLLLSFFNSPYLFKVLLFILFAVSAFPLIKHAVSQKNISSIILSIITVSYFLLIYSSIAHNLWSEALFIPLLIILFVRYHRSPRVDTILILLLVLLTLTRVVGITVGGALAIFHFLQYRELKSSLKIISASFLPLIIWLALISLYGESMPRKLSLHLIGQPHFELLLENFATLVPHLTVSFFTLTALSIVTVFIKRLENIRLYFPVFWIICYLLFLFFSISMLDTATPLDERILMPVFIALAFFITNVKINSLLFSAGFAFIFLVNIGPKSIEVWNNSKNGYGYNTAFFHEEQFPKTLKNYEWDSKVYTTDQRYFYYITKQKAGDLPQKVNPYSNLINEDFAEEWQNFILHAKENKAAIVWIRNGSKNHLYPSHEEINDIPGIQIVYQDYYLTIAIF